jgi:hypothetical protein
VKDKIRQRTIEAYKLETTLMKKIIALAVAAVVAAPAMADLTIGGSARYQADNGSGDFTGGTTNRVLMSVAGSSTAESGMFVSASATLQMTGAAGVSRDGDNAVTIGNSAANVVLGAFEPAGAFSSGADQFQVGGLAGFEGALRARENDNIGLNVTAVEGLTLQISTDVSSQDNVRAVVGYDFGAFKASAGFTTADAAANEGYSVTASTTLGGVAVAASYGENDANDSSMNVNASYMGFGLAYQNDETAGVEQDELYGSYAVANAAGLEGLTVTVGAGSADGADSKYGVRLDYAF